MLPGLANIVHFFNHLNEIVDLAVRRSTHQISITSSTTFHSLSPLFFYLLTGIHSLKVRHFTIPHFCLSQLTGRAATPFTPTTNRTVFQAVILLRKLSSGEISDEQLSDMALVLRKYGRAADPIEIVDDTDVDDIETIDITEDGDEEQAMSDTDSLPSDIEDGKDFNNQGTDELFYAYDAEEELDQFVVTPDLGSVIDSIGSVEKSHRSFPPLQEKQESSIPANFNSYSKLKTT